MSCWTAWTNGSTCCGGAAAGGTAAATAREVAVACVDGTGFVDSGFGVAEGVAAMGLSVGAGSGAAVGVATAATTGATGEAVTAWGPTSAAVTCAAALGGDAASRAVIRPAKNPMPIITTESAAGMAQAGRLVRTGSSRTTRSPRRPRPAAARRRQAEQASRVERVRPHSRELGSPHRAVPAPTVWPQRHPPAPVRQRAPHPRARVQQWRRVEEEAASSGGAREGALWTASVAAEPETADSAPV